MNRRQRRHKHQHSAREAKALLPHSSNPPADHSSRLMHTSVCSDYLQPVASDRAPQPAPLAQAQTQPTRRSMINNSVVFKDGRALTYSGYELPDDLQKHDSRVQGQQQVVVANHEQQDKNFTFPVLMQRSTCSGYEQPIPARDDVTGSRGFRIVTRDPDAYVDRDSHMYASVCSATAYEEPCDVDDVIPPSSDCDVIAIKRMPADGKEDRSVIRMWEKVSSCNEM